MVKEHGLNVYFDGDFSGYNPLWKDHFPENMESGNCRGVVAFIDDAYKIIIDEENIKKNTINTIKESKTVSEHVENSPLTDGYNYTIFGKSYTAGSSS